jgi:hypothetical protein
VEPANLSGCVFRLTAGLAAAFLAAIPAAATFLAALATFLAALAAFLLAAVAAFLVRLLFLFPLRHLDISFRG